MPCVLKRFLKNMTRKKYAILFICLATLLWRVGPACAHKVSVFAYVRGDHVVAQAYFGGKAKAMDCTVEVFDAAGVKLKEGKTDANGIFSFPVTDLGPISGAVRVQLTAGMGHKADYTIAASEFPSSPRSASTEQANAPAEKSPVSPQAQLGDTEAIKKIVDDTIRARLEPVVAMLGTLQKLSLERKDKSPGLTEIVGGVGWILGIVGVGAYFASRRRMTGK
jgi:nickel transport protein